MSPLTRPAIPNRPHVQRQRSQSHCLALPLSSAVVALCLCCPYLLALSAGHLVVFVFPIMVCALMYLPDSGSADGKKFLTEGATQKFDVMTEASGLHGKEE